MAKPWERDWGAAPAAPSSSGPQVVFQAPPDPYKQAAEARANRDQQLQEEAAARARARDEREIKKYDRENAETQTPGNTTLSGDAYLATIPQPLAAQVKALAEGRRAFPTGSALRSPQVQELVAAATQYDPTLDAANATTRVKARSDFTSGMTSRNITAMNTALGHLGTLSEAVKGLDNGSFPWWNTIANATETAIGDPRVKRFTLARDAVANELMKVFRGSGGSLTEIEEWKHNIDSSDSPEQLNAAIKQGVELLNSRLEAVNDQYGRAMGRSSDPMQFLSPHAREVYSRLTGGADIAADGNIVAPAETIVPKTIADKINADRLTPEQESAYDAFNRANPKATAEQLRAFASSIGVNLGNAEEIVRDRDAGRGIAAGNQARYQAPDISDVRGQGGAGEGADAFVRGAADTSSLGFADEIAAAGDTLTGDQTMNYNLRRQRAIDRYDAENSPWLRGSGQLAGGFLLPIGRGATTMRELAGAGGIAGAGYGIGSGENLQDRTLGGLAGGVTGAALGAGFGKLGDIWRGRAASRNIPPGGGDSGGGPGGPPMPPDDLSGVAARMGVTPSPATVGGRTSEAMQIGLGNAPGSMGPVRAGVEAETQGLADFARNTAARIGPVSTPQQAGEILSRGARVADRAQARSAGRAYNSRTEMMGGEGAPVTMGGTQTAIRNVAGDFPSNEVIGDLLTHPLIRRLENADAPELTLGESTELLSEARRVLRRARETKQPGRLVNQLRSVEQSIEGDVMRAAQASDAIAGRASGEGAAAMQRRGDSLWADRMQAQKQEFKRMLASSTDDVNTSGESVYRQLFNDMREEGGNLVRLRRTLDRLPRRARETFSASAFDDLGKARPSAQNADGDAWSFQTFMTNWGKMSEEAKRTVFQGRGVDREISDIVRYADRLRDLDKARNFSNTGATAANASYITALVGSLFTTTPAGTAAVAGVYPAMNVAGRAFMATPALRSWLRNVMQGATRGNESQVRTLVRRLPALAAKNPALSAEISQFERSILSAVNDNAPRAAAASEGQQENR